MNYLNDIRQQLAEMHAETEQWTQEMEKLELERNDKKLKSEKSILNRFKSLIAKALTKIKTRIVG